MDDVFIRFWSGSLRARVVRFVSHRVPGTVVDAVITPRFALSESLLYSLLGMVCDCCHFTDEEIVREKVSEVSRSGAS